MPCGTVRIHTKVKHQRSYVYVQLVLLRSPTIAKELLLLGYNTRSCGCQDYALIPIDEVLIEWADVVVFADKEHKTTVNQTQCLSGKEIYILDIPDNFGYNDLI